MGYLYNDNSDSSVRSTDDTFINHVVWDTFIMTTVTQVLDVQMTHLSGMWCIMTTVTQVLDVQMTHLLGMWCGIPL